MQKKTENNEAVSKLKQCGLKADQIILLCF